MEIITFQNDGECTNVKEITGLSGLTHNFENVFLYARFCEVNANNAKRNMVGDSIIDTTFTSDLSIAEYCERYYPEEYSESFAAVEDTITRSCSDWKYDVDYIIALLFAINLKAFEHHALATNDNYDKFRAFSREIHEGYSRYYSDRYYTLRDYVINTLYAGDEHKAEREAVWQKSD